jgi:hypothetical protein
MNKLMFGIGIFLTILSFVCLYVSVELDKDKSYVEGKCYDRVGSEIIGVTCLEEVKDKGYYTSLILLIMFMALFVIGLFGFILSSFRK